MFYVVLYFTILVIGYFMGSKLRSKKEKMGFIGTILLFCVSLMVFLMGIKMGSNEEVIDNLGVIGLQSVVVTIVLWGCSILSVTLLRKVLGMNKYGLTKAQQEQLEVHEEHLEQKQEPEEEKKTNGNLMTILIVIFVALGLAVGYFVVRPYVVDKEAFEVLTGNIMTGGLCLLMWSVGFDLGLEGTVIGYLKGAGFRVLLFPIAIILGTTAAGFIICMIFSDLSFGESLAIGYGFGWYTFAPISIANAGFIMASAVAFLSNVIRELGGIVLIPVLAKKLGYIEVASLPGVAAMDVCLPIMEKATRQDMIVYSFVIGLTEGVLVPMLVSMALSIA
ncbi:MAG: lysine exporter LysO family protein [Firmicutes bacterium]|nr:lysine exporter LysO family protein [Bacillota bacterium]